MEPKLEFLVQLKDMGFPEDLARKALIKVKNESVASAVEAVVALQAEDIALTALQTKVDKKVTLVQWTCERCTVVNPPGGCTCHVCFGQAPAYAYIDEEAEKLKSDAENKKKKEEEQRVLKEN